MESYEQKYKAALEWMKSLYGGLHGKTKEEAEKYFPELKESEDERVKKELIELISCMHDADPRKKGWISWLEKQGMKEPAAKVESKFKVKYAGNEYNVFETKDIAGVTFYGIEDEPNHIDYVKAENCEIISVYAIKENGSPYPTKPAVFSEKKPKRMISAEAKECIYGSDNEQVSSEKISKNDTLYDLLRKMPSYITVDGLDYHFVLKKIGVYIAYYECEGEEGRDKIIFWMAGEPVDILTEMLEKLKEKGLLE